MIDIDRDQYEFSHGKAPRGDGLWLFTIHRNGACTDVSYNGPFRDALAHAKREARAVGAHTIVVLP